MQYIWAVWPFQPPSACSHHSLPRYEPLLSLNQACQHVFWDCVSCQYVPAPMSSRQIRLHMSHFANKVTWCLWGKILRCAAAAAAGGCVDAALQGHSEQKEGSYIVLNMKTQLYTQHAHMVVLPYILDTLSIPFPYFTCALPPLGCTACKNFCTKHSKMHWNYQQNVMKKKIGILSKSTMYCVAGLSCQPASLWL